ncbi:MFS transporter [Cryobacterium sp. SO2]|uniref:MFS transporter n=1 Tax=Cryobacterium sp. SO2 TaxID=1897060 RepID=UPI00223DB271|nr:MFS transporter [Cryobacterium sp. SO2]WEO77931.1 MFS transporter [Cryobacterium sp. SO2]
MSAGGRDGRERHQVYFDRLSTASTSSTSGLGATAGAGSTSQVSTSSTSGMGATAGAGSTSQVYFHKLSTASTSSTSQAGPARGLLALFTLLGGHGLSLLGNVITVIVVPLYVLHDTGSVLATGVAGVFATLPVIVGGALGGVLVDRIGFRTAAIVADLASGATILLIPVLAATTGLPFPVLLTLVFLSGLLDTPGNTAKSALVPDLAEAAGLSVTRATGIHSAVSRSAAMLGASVAAICVVWLGPLNALLIDAATFAASALLLWLGVPRHADAGPAAAEAAASTELPAGWRGYWADFAAGLRFLWQRPLLRYLVLMIVVTNCFDAAGITVLMPAYASTVGADGAIFGVMVAVFSGGALSGAALFTWLGHRLPRRPLLVLSFFLAGAPPYLAMAAGVPVPVLLAVLAVAGLAAGSINPLITTVLYERVPREFRARVLGAMTTGVSLGLPLGSGLAGVVVSAAGLVPVLLVIGVLYALVTLAPLTGGSWRGIERADGESVSVAP